MSCTEEKHTKKKLKTGDTIILNAAHNRDYVGSKSAFISSELNGVIATGEWLIVRVDEADPAFVSYFLKSPLGRENLKNCVKGIHLYPKDVERIKIPLPPLDDQKRIAYLLGKVEGAIAQRKQNLQQLDDLLKSIFLDMFGDPVQNEAGWVTLPFSQIGKFTSGGTPSKKRDDFWSGKFPWVSPKDMKTSRIEDSIDHISELVFEETNLKRIFPNHLLIVVRGLILAHSFPVAINNVEVTINQDMKAIKPIKGMNVVYLEHCLKNQKRQILKLVSVAGHGTRRFDSLAMKMLLIPCPPPELQEQFSILAKKIEDIKFYYQKTLGDLESLYGAISQRAFTGVLDLSRVPIISEITEIPEETHETDEPQKAYTFTLPTPSNIASLNSANGRNRLLNQWWTVWVEHLNGTPVSTQPFMNAAQQKLWELVNDDDAQDFGVEEYEQVKVRIFEAIECNQLQQTRNKVKMHDKQEDGNSVILNKVISR